MNKCEVCEKAYWDDVFNPDLGLCVHCEGVLVS